MGSGASSGDNRVLPEPLASGTERDEFERLLKEPVDAGNPHGWQIKKPWPATYRDNFKMRVCLRKHESGNPNMLLRADGKFKGVVPQDFLDFLLKPENLPGLQEYRVVETIPDGVIMYMRVKAPGMKARDHVWKYTIDKRGGGSIFVTLRTVAHDQCPVTASAIRVYYYNSSEFKMSAEEDGVMEMTEFIFMDLKGKLPVWLLNFALPAGTIDTNRKEMAYLNKKKATAASGAAA
ncbi:unnamed protein product [Polarella glacialis]|uniref:START domain-containing protein n=1 Tax=Polarella glacialis TaxID=89957 RepID=A0A813KQ88_POLGL|nr:unnamed protein product [Polarella glacialis]